MAKITAEQLEIAKGWQEFGERLGWKVVECDPGLAKFSRDSGSSFFKIWLPERQDIERSWRELEASLDERVIQYEKRSGTDG